MNAGDGRAGLLLNALAQVCSVLAVCFGFTALLGWVLALPLLSSFGRHLIPMAPSTALLFALLGIAAFFSARLPLNRGIHWMGMAIGSLVAMLAVLLFFLSFLQIRPQTEHLGIRIVGTLDGTPIGHMSPVTALSFVLAGYSFLASLSSSHDRPRRATVALWFASLIILANWALALAYLIGPPFLYGGKFIPPALPTSLAFVSLGIALLAFSRTQAGYYGEPTENANVGASFALFMFFAILALSIVTVGWLYYHNYEKQYRIEIEQELSAVAELKVGELVQWRKERLGDGSVFYKNTAFSSLVKRYFENPQDLEPQGQLRTWLHLVQEHYEYDRISLLDAQGVERMAIPRTPDPVAPHLLQDLPEIFRSRQVVFLGFHRDAEDRPIRLAVLIPVLEQQNSSRAIGILVLKIDPEKHLYPLISRWPTPSQTAETLLIRREGNEAVFLNELKFKKNTALTLRIPLDQEDMPTVKAALGQTGIVEGLDYRGVPVIADARAIPGSPWFLVARIDAAEVYAPLRTRLWVTVLVVGLLLFSAGAGTGLIWRQQLARYNRERYDASEALRQSGARFRRLAENAHDLIYRYEFTPRRGFTYINSAATAITGYTLDDYYADPELRNKVVHPEDRHLLEAATQGGFLPGELTLRWVHKDGTLIWIELRRVPVYDDDGNLVAVEGIARDITERKRAEEKIANLNRTLRAIRDINQMIVQEKDPQKLIHRTSEILVEHPAYHAALLILTDEAGKPLAHAVAGMKEILQPMVEHLGKGTVPPCCEAARFHDGLLSVPGHSGICAPCLITSNCDRGDIMCLWLQHDGTIYGYLAGSVADAARIDPEQQSLFTDMAGDVAFALHNIQKDKAMQEMHEERDRFEAELRQAQKMEAIGSLAGGIAHDFNNILTAIIGYTQLAEQDVESGSLLRRNLQEVLKAGNRAKDLVKQILTFSRQSGKELVPVQVKLIVKEALKLLRASLPSTIEIRQHIQSDSTVWSDPTQIHQVLMNLCTNAAHAMRLKGGILEMSLKDVALDDRSVAQHPGSKEGQYLVLEVADTGHGIDPSIKDRIFDPFFTTKERGEGTGMGLAVVHGIVKNCGGFISVYSEVGRGSTFRIYFPSSVQKEKPEGLMEPPIPGGRERILFVDDEPALVDMTKQVLERLGYLVTGRTSSIEALALFQARPDDFDLLITDLTMPKLTGEDLAKKILSLRKGLPIILCTGFSAKFTEERSKENGIGAFVMKPLVLADLARTIRECLDQKK
jgi:PAS domain S-box-containing protein